MSKPAASFSHRLAMYDYATGQCVREDYLMSLLDTLPKMGLTGLSIYLEDLAMFVLPSIFKGSIDLAGWRRLDSYARGKGLLLLPVINLYGHAHQTLAHAEFSDLADDEAAFTLDYGNPRTKPVVEQTLDIALEVFNSPFIHIGFDEPWGMGRKSERTTGQPADVPSVFTANLAWAGGQVIRRGRRPMFWGDVPGVYYPEIVSELPRELIPVDWFYRKEPAYPSMSRWTEAGFDLWVAPTIGFTEDIYPDFGKLEAHVGTVLNAGKQAGASGVIFTAWHQGNFPFSDRLPFLAWQAALAAGDKNTSISMRKSMVDWLEPQWGAEAPEFVAAALELGSLDRLLPHESRVKYPDKAKLRMEWFRNNPFAREKIDKIRGILDRCEPVARKFPSLSLAHRRFSFLANLLDPEKIDPAELAKEATFLDAETRRSWLTERSAERYDQQIAPAWRRLVAELERWPAHARESAPSYNPPIIYANRGEKDAVPNVHGFHVDRSSIETEPTSFYAWYTPRALHFLFECRQKRAPRAAEKSVDFLLTRDDLVAVCLDVEGKGQGYLWMEANPAGTAYCQVHDADNANSEWHPLGGRKDWAKPSAVSEGWGVEFCLPFVELGIATPRPGASLGITLERRSAWKAAPISRWGGLERGSRDHPTCFAKLVLL